MHCLSLSDQGKAKKKGTPGSRQSRQHELSQDQMEEDPWKGTSDVSGPNWTTKQRFIVNSDVNSAISVKIKEGRKCQEEY